MLVTVCGYEQNPSSGVGFRVVRTYIRTIGRTDGEVQIFMPTQNFVGALKTTTGKPIKK